MEAIEGKSMKVSFFLPYRRKQVKVTANQSVSNKDIHPRKRATPAEDPLPSHSYIS